LAGGAGGSGPAGPYDAEAQWGFPYEGDGPADPVRELMHRYRELCERAVDPLEIAAGLEARGISDRAAARRFRHRDVFSLAEELYARVPPVEGGASAVCGPAAPEAPGAGGARGGSRGGAPGAVATVLLPLLPVVLCAAAFAALSLVPGRISATEPGVLAAAGACAASVGGCVWLALRRVARAAVPPLWMLPACLLTACLLLAEPLAELCGGEDSALHWARPCPPPSVVLGLLGTVAPAVWASRGFAVRARARLVESRGLDEFAARVRPLLAGCTAVFVLAMAGMFAGAWLLGRVPPGGAGSRPVTGAGTGAAPVTAVPPAPSGELPGAAREFVMAGAAMALGLLLFTAVLLAAHGALRAACAGLWTACLLQAATFAAVLAARLLGAVQQPPVRPVTEAMAAYGPAVVPGAACGCVAAALLAYAFRALARASAHDAGAAGAGAADGAEPCL